MESWWNSGSLWWNSGGIPWNLTSGPPRTTPEPIWAETPKLSAVGEKKKACFLTRSTFLVGECLVSDLDPPKWLRSLCWFPNQPKKGVLRQATRVLPKTDLPLSRKCLARCRKALHDLLQKADGYHKARGFRRSGWAGLGWAGEGGVGWVANRRTPTVGCCPSRFAHPGVNAKVGYVT